MATSDLLSNAQQVTSVDGNSIIPVASAAGQPTRNVKLSTLASVVGGLIGVATESKNGLMSMSDFFALPRRYEFVNREISISDLPIGFSYLYNVTNEYPDKNGCVLKFKYGRTSFLQGFFVTGFYIRCILDGNDTGWKKISTT